MSATYAITEHTVELETPKAFLIKVNGSESWIPKSQIQVVDDALHVPEWLFARLPLAIRKTSTQLATAPTPQPEVGFYLVNADEFYRVQWNRTETSRYAKQWVGREWVYVGRQPFALLTDKTRMSLEEAAEFGHQFGQCIVCGASLTDPASVTRGIGPVCIKKFDGC